MKTVIFILALHLGYGATSQQIPVKDMATCQMLRTQVLNEWNSHTSVDGYLGSASGICIETTN